MNEGGSEGVVSESLVFVPRLSAVLLLSENETCND